MWEMFMENEKIYVFDAYGTLFDVDHACKEMAIQLGDNWNKLSSIWRQKQLEYSWLHNSMKNYVSFWQITKDSLCLLYTSPSPRDRSISRMPSSA